VLEKKENIHSAAVATFLSSQAETVAKASSQAKAIIADAEKKAKNIIDDAVANTRKLKEDMSSWEEEKKTIASSQTIQPRIKLDIGGVRLVTSAVTLTRFPDSMLGTMFSGRHVLPLDEDGYIFIDRDGTHFRHILNFLRDPERFSLELSGGHKTELMRESEYYGLDKDMFPFVPADSVVEQSTFQSYTDQYNRQAARNPVEVTISQTDVGMWTFKTHDVQQQQQQHHFHNYVQAVQSTQASKSIDATVCRKCNGAYVKSPYYCPSYQKKSEGVVGFKHFLTSDRTLDNDGQPEPDGVCLICKI
jgi:hypothetical protein